MAETKTKTVVGYERVQRLARAKYGPRGWFWAHDLLDDGGCWNTYKKYAFRLAGELGWQPYKWRAPLSTRGFWLFVAHPAYLPEACAALAKPVQPTDQKLLDEYERWRNNEVE